MMKQFSQIGGGLLLFFLLVFGLLKNEEKLSLAVWSNLCLKVRVSGDFLLAVIGERKVDFFILFMKIVDLFLCVSVYVSYQRNLEFFFMKLRGANDKVSRG